MAVAAPLPDFLEEATCSICLDYFQDPVLIPECGHNFCRGCLTRSWRTSESEASCPQCRQTFGPRNVLPNRQLARLVEVARRCEDPWGEEGGSDHIEKEKKNVVAEFRELQLWLEAQEELILASMEEMEKDIMAIKEKGLAKHMEDLYQAKETYENPVDLLVDPMWTIWDYSDLAVLLKRAMKKFRDTLESGLQLQEEASPFVHACDILMLVEKRAELPHIPSCAPSSLWGDPSDSTSSELKHDGLLLCLIFWIKAPVNVILDRCTAHPDLLYIPKDGKSVRGIKPAKQIYRSPNSKRFELSPCVLGCQRFSTGRHFWEVTVRNSKGWRVGITNMPVNVTNLDLQTSQWVFRKWGEKYMAISSSVCSELVLTEKPTRIRISLNCEGGQVSFFDARTAALLYTFSDASLVGETLLPSFCLYEGSSLSLP
ncbi:hypothetical protein Chor_011607 [Crotalus horridus]